MNTPHRPDADPDKDNNTAERAIRTPVVGRKNYHGSGAAWRAGLAGHAWTILRTARMPGTNPAPTWTPTWTPAPPAAASRPRQALAALLPWNITCPQAGQQEGPPAVTVPGTPRHTGPSRYCGRDFTPAELDVIAGLAAALPAAPRSPAPSATPSLARPGGRRKDMTAASPSTACPPTT